MLHLSVACAHQNRISTDSAQVASHVIHSLELQKDRLEVVKSDLPGNIRLASNILNRALSVVCWEKMLTYLLQLVVQTSCQEAGLLPSLCLEGA